MKGKSVETKFEKSSVIRQPNAFKRPRQLVLGKPATFSDSLAKTDFSKSKSVTTNNVSNDFSNPVTAQILPQNVKSILKNTNVIAPGIGLHAQVRTVRTDRGTEFLNKTLHAYFAQEGIEHEMSTAQTPKQNDVVERRNRTLVEAARTMLSAAKVPLYSTQSRAYRVYNKRTRVIVETNHVNFDELPHMASDHVRSDPILQCLTTALEHASLSPSPQSQENVPQSVEIVTTSNELDFLFSPMFNELLNGTTLVVSKSFTVTATNAPNQRQQQHTTPSTLTNVATNTPPLNIQTTPETASQAPTQAPTVTTNENINQAKTNKENAQVEDDEYINIFSTPVQEPGETSSLHVDSSNMHTIYQRHPSKHRWTKDNLIEQIIRNPSQSIRTRR
ncbi:retrovirus-related pol polyprotein from transposon TNT 1-94 [Tanacetum coccineum]